MGTWDLWCGRGLSLLRQNGGPEYRPGTGGAPRRDSTGSPEATACAHESLQRPHPGANATNGLVITRSASGQSEDNLCRQLSIEGLTRPDTRSAKIGPKG